MPGSNSVSYVGRFEEECLPCVHLSSLATWLKTEPPRSQTFRHVYFCGGLTEVEDPCPVWAAATNRLGSQTELKRGERGKPAERYYIPFSLHPGLPRWEGSELWTPAAIGWALPSPPRWAVLWQTELQWTLLPVSFFLLDTFLQQWEDSWTRQPSIQPF